MVIGEINQQMPWVEGETFLYPSQIHYAIQTDRSLPQVNTEPLTEADRKIGDYIASLIPDGATVQFGDRQDIPLLLSIAEREETFGDPLGTSGR